MKYLVPNCLSFGHEQNKRSSLGHVYMNWLSAVLLADKYDLKFQHIPFTKDSERWNDILNLDLVFHLWEGGEVATLPEFRHSGEVRGLIDSFPDETTIRTAYSQYPFDLVDRFDWFTLGADLRKAYWKNKITTDNRTIAIHIRRGDITAASKDRWTGIEYYRKLIPWLKEKHPDHDVVVYSEPNLEPLNDATLSLESDDTTAFQEMCNADILVTCKSTFSIVAAIYNPNTVYYIPLREFTEILASNGHRQLPEYSELV